MSNGHPTYPNPIISEALCEIHYKLPPDKLWKPSIPGKLFVNIQTDFPEMEPCIDMGVEVEIGPKGVGQKIVPSRQRTIFRHKNNRLILQLSQDIFTVNVLPRYEGWKKMKEDVLNGWEKACNVLEPVSVTRIGLRYINSIPRESENEPADKWLLSGDYIAPAILRSKPTFLSRNELRLDDSDRLILTIGTTKTSQQKPYGFLIFDIDRIYEGDLGIEGSVMKDIIQKLHDHAWDIFSNTKTNDLEKLLMRTSQ